MSRPLLCGLRAAIGVLCALTCAPLVRADAGVAAESPLRPVAYSGDGAALILRFDESALDALRHDARVCLLGFALPDGEHVDLELERFEVLAADAQLVIAGPAGETLSERPDVVLWRGSITDRADSWAYLALSPHGCNGLLALDDRQFLLAAGTYGSGESVLYEPARMPAGRPATALPTCGVDALPNGGRVGPLPAGSSQGGPRTAACREVRIAIDSDWEFAQLAAFGGSGAAAQAYAVALLGAVSDIYQRDCNAALTVGYLRVWSWDGDPYGSASIDERLDEFRQHWSATMGSVSRSTAHLLSGVRQGAGGVAYLGALCSNSWGYGVSGYLVGSFPQPVANNNDNNWDVYVAAHEIGHSFGAVHTHDLAPPADGCGGSPQRCRDANQGTIMSYCHTCPGGVGNIRLNMHTRNVNENILPYLDALTVCNLLRTPVAITSHPFTRRVGLWTPVSFSVAGSGSGPLSFQWRRNGAALANDGRITGVTSATLNIAYVLPSDMGVYDAVVSNACNDALSNPAGLSLFSPCPGDADGDGRVGQDDLDYILTYYGATVPQGVNGDVDLNGVVNQEDLDLALFQYGCGS